MPREALIDQPRVTLAAESSAAHLEPTSRIEVGELIDQLAVIDSLEIADTDVDRLFKFVGGIPLAIE